MVGVVRVEPADSVSVDCLKVPLTTLSSSSSGILEAPKSAELEVLELDAGIASAATGPSVTGSVGEGVGGRVGGGVGGGVVVVLVELTSVASVVVLAELASVASFVVVLASAVVLVELVALVAVVVLVVAVELVVVCSFTQVPISVHSASDSDPGGPLMHMASHL